MQCKRSSLNNDSISQAKWYSWGGLLTTRTKLVNNFDLLTITPGIRIKSLGDDQVRTMSPKEAIANGSNYLVIGRPTTSSANIAKALEEIMTQS